MHIAILGRGVFGKAIGSLLTENGFAYEAIDKGEFFSNKPDILFLSVPVQLMRQALNERKSSFSLQTILINCSKGIERDTQALPFQIIKDVLGKCGYAAMLGPSFAAEIMNKCPTRVSLGSESKIQIAKIQSLVQRPYFRISPTPFYESLELASAMKNVYAIVCGFSQGRLLGKNILARLMTQALQEFECLATAMKFKYESVAVPGIVGDFVLTGTSPESRNFSYGCALGQGVVEKVGDKTVEGYHTVEALLALEKRYKVSLPLARLAKIILEKGPDLPVTWAVDQLD